MHNATMPYAPMYPSMGLAHIKLPRIGSTSTYAGKIERVKAKRSPILL